MGEHILTSRPIEGDYIETVDGLFFAVKGISHPKGKVIAYLRYILDARGERSRGGERYRRVYNIDETTELLRKQHPQYLSYVKSLGLTLQTVPWDRIAKVHKPRKRLINLRAKFKTDLDRTVVKFASALSSESNIPIEEIGVSGSVLIGLASQSSDVDLIVYGRVEGLKAYDALLRLRDACDWITSYDGRTIETVLKARWGDADLDLERFRDIEVRKILHGLVRGRDYFVRLVKKPEEVEAEIASKPLYKARLRAIVSDGSDAIFTPCTYHVKDPVPIEYPCHNEISELVSFRGKFTEQAREGDLVEAYGTLEKVTFSDKVVYRVVLGSEGDYLIPI